MVAAAGARALGTGVQVVLTDGTRIERAQATVLAWLAELDRVASRFRDDSELSLINRGEGRPVPVSSLCCELVSVALDVAQRTGGLVDPTLGAALEGAGYDRDFDEIQRAPAAAPQVASAAGGAWRQVEVDAARVTVRVPAGVRLDLGASAKARAADVCAALAAETAGCGALVNLGGDLAVCGEPPSGGWQVHVTDDHAAGAAAPGQTVAIMSGGLATSSTTVRAWTTASGPAHHIIDPLTGRPAQVVWRTVSATAPTCVAANAATTAAVVLGQQAPSWLVERGIPARLVALDGATRHLCGWPADGEEQR